jgi:hypothetical protein
VKRRSSCSFWGCANQLGAVRHLPAAASLGHEAGQPSPGWGITEISRSEPLDDFIPLGLKLFLAQQPIVT